MTETRSALIVSHGQPSDPDPAERDLARFGTRVARALPGWHVGTATLAKPGALDAALAVAGPAPVVYPMFMTEGWFTGENLRNRLGNAPGARVLRPLGVSPDLPGLAADLIGDQIARAGWSPGETRLFLAAHGSGRSPNSARDTRAFAAALAHHIALAEISVGFVEEPPYLVDAATGMGERSLCLPFFAAAGGHVTDDIPEALDKADFSGLRLAPLGLAPAVPDLVARAIASDR
ncbi:sirohydrochlorin chelatase [Roseovarius nitratireducens]|uniref:sirohydrochlorin chelatase n=1 Tax=Roseovarius nitratireducens TaxID=2044597 RepID=UPI000CE28C4F|nr:CbiX/SirB N-terminal domain-containing protein [Roseovarius nitratireducens]